MSYKKFSECGKPLQYNLMGESRIMNPLIVGLEFRNKFKIQNNEMRILPPVLTKNIDYSRLSSAYPQENKQ